MSGPDAKVILLFALLGTALAFTTPNVVEEDSLPASPELTLQQDKAELMLTYAKIAEQHAEVYISIHEYLSSHARLV